MTIGKHSKCVAVWLGLLISAVAQPTTNTNVNADCLIPINAVTATGFNPASAGFDNRNTGCSYWIFQYVSSGFSVVSINVQSAPDNAGAAGSWVTWAGTVAGTLPITQTTQATIQLGGYFPWVRINRATLTGSGQLSGTLQGWKNPPSPCLTGTIVSAVFNTSASGDTQIIAPVAGQTVRVCHWDAVPASAIAIGLDQGTGTNCATGNSTLAQQQAGITSIVMDYQPGLLALVGNAVCINLGTGVATKGTIIYAQQP